MSDEKVERVLIPYVGDELPKKAEKQAFKRLKKNGKLFLLHIEDEEPARRLRYKTGHIGDESQTIKKFKESMEEIHKKSAKDYIEKVKKKATDQDIFVKSLFTEGSPEEEVLKAIEENSIQLVLVEQLRNEVIQIFEGDLIDYIQEKSECKVEKSTK